MTKMAFARREPLCRLVEENAFRVTISSWTKRKLRLALTFPTLISGT
jgi:hypothetical protein